MTPATDQIIYKSPVADIAIPEVPITEWVLRRATARANHTALVDASSSNSLTYAELDTRIHRLAGGLANMGIGKGSVIALIAPNLPEYAIVFHAIAVAGAAVTTVNPTYGSEEIRHQLIDAGATLAITVPLFLETVKAATNGTNAGEVVVIGEADGHRNIVDLESDPIKQVAIDVFNDIVVLPYSSGTTGLPKGVMLTHHNLVANICQTNGMLNYREDDIGLAVLPFFHIYGMQVLMNGWLAEGSTVVTMPRFDMEDALATIQRHKITQFFAVPPIVLGMAKSPLTDKYDLSSLTRVFSGAAPLGADLSEEASARIDCPVVQGYGLTEASPVTHVSSGQLKKAGCSGVTVPNTLCRLIDENGQDVPAGESGELLIKGPQVMKGYLGNKEATHATIDDGNWLHTGDVACIDEDGFITLVDRVKELIKYKGFQVAPAELEALIVTHPSVADVAVIGIADEEAGEIPKAFVVSKPDTSPDGDSIKAFVKDRLASYKQVREVEFVDAIPKSPSGKILRRVLRDSAN